MAPITVVLADDHPLIRDAVGALFERADDITVRAVVDSGEALVTAARHHQPDVVVSDLHMPNSPLNGLDAVRAIVERRPDAKVLMLTAHGERQRVSQALEAGATGYVLKTERPALIVDAVRKVSVGQPVLSAEVTKALVEQMRSAPVALSDRQVQILRLLAAGHSRDEVARQLHLSLSTVKAHLTDAFRRLDVANVTGAVNRARELELI
jgi:DNA-binding NarL/FixJ family response regulator